MSIEKKKRFMKMILIVDCSILVLVFSLLTMNHNQTTEFDNKKVSNSNETKTTEFALEVTKEPSEQVAPAIEQTQEVQTVETEQVEEIVKPNVVYDGLTMEELSAKLDRSLNSTLAGTGSLFASYALQLGIDPYLAVAIVLQETGCKWDCSQLVKQCNNVGGQQGSPSCGTTGYKAYATLEEGIKGFMDNLYYNYYAQGLTTPETINTKYASSQTWASKINNYIYAIKTS